MKISVVMAYNNRKNLLINTLKSISKSKCEDFEVIIVDDASDENNRLEDLINEFCFINIVRLEPENKWYKNSCIPFNKGFKKASGDIVIIQNPECFHTDDILSYVEENLKEEDYFIFGCFSLDKHHTSMLNSNPDFYKEIVYNEQKMKHDGDFGWYNHSIYRAVGYHFTSAIYKNKLDLLNGFDERYAMGCNYDDVEFVHRVKKVCDFKFIDDLIVLHQNHYEHNKTEKNKTINKDLYYNVTLKENKIRVNE